MSAPTGPAQYKLTYFNSRALAENTRFLFALANVQYVDYRYPEVPSDKPYQPIRPEFNAIKETLPFGQVPILQIGGDDGIVLSQSRAIERYLAREFGYMGSTAIEAQLIDTMSEAMRDLRDAFMKVRFGPPEEKSIFYTNVLPKHLSYWNRFAETHSTSNEKNTFVGNKVSLADIQLYTIFDSPLLEQDLVQSTISSYPLLVAIRANVANQPQIAKWIAERPKTPY